MGSFLSEFAEKSSVFVTVNFLTDTSRDSDGALAIPLSPQNKDMAI